MTVDDGFFAEPDDTLWNRGGNPFTAGEASADPGRFPPTPWTWQGFVRTRILTMLLGDRLSQAPRAEIARIVGPPDSLPPGWRLSGPLPATLVDREIRGQRVVFVEPWVPWPMFLSAAREPDPGSARAPAPFRSHVRPIDGFLANSVSRPQGFTSGLLGFPAGHAAAESGWISADNLRWALLGAGGAGVQSWAPAREPGREREQGWGGATSAAAKRAQGGADLPPFVKEEPRTGLVIDDVRGTAADHLLYTAVHHRFAPRAGLWGGLGGARPEVLRALRSGPASLGHKGRTVCLSGPPAVPGWNELLAGDHLADLPEHAHVRVVLLTPAEVRAALPFRLPPGAEVLGQQARRGPAIGGVDWVGGTSRPVRDTWAAGSSFWVRLNQPTAAQRRDAALQLAGLLEPEEHERFGFGLRVVAAFSPETGLPLDLSTSGLSNRKDPHHG